VGGNLPAKVLSTPAMVGIIEWCASTLSQEHLPDGKVTVGFEVCVKHVGAAPEGARCTVHARLREVVDDRKLRFDGDVREGDRTIGVGTHERRVVNRAAFLQSPG
jgi:fluoroacetyl-CoA thioesterase